ncbi:MAG: LysR substrate-binding domain-containing protein, partial [Nocardioidaceae bacterium]
EAEADELLDRVKDRDLDVALVYRYDLVPRPRPEGLTVLPLLREDLRLLIAEGHRLAGKDQALELSDLTAETWIATNPGSPGALCMLHLCADAGFEPHVAFRSNDYDVIHGFVEAGLGIALVPALSFDSRRTVDTRSLQGLAVGRHVDIVHRESNENPLLASFIASLRWSAKAVLSEGLVLA